MREDIPVAKRLLISFMVNTDKEYMGGFRYIVGRNFALSATIIVIWVLVQG